MGVSFLTLPSRGADPMWRNNYCHLRTVSAARERGGGTTFLTSLLLDQVRLHLFLFTAMEIFDDFLMLKAEHQDQNPDIVITIFLEPRERNNKQ